MKTFGLFALLAALALAGCGPESARPGNALERSKIIPPGPTGPVFESIGVVSRATSRELVLDHEGAPDAGLAAGRTTFRTWADVIAGAPGEPGDRVAFRFQRLGDGWAVVEMTGR